MLARLAILAASVATGAIAGVAAMYIALTLTDDHGAL